MKKKINSVDLIILFIQLLIAIILIIMFLSKSEYKQELFGLGNWGILSICFTIWGVFSWYHITKNLLSYYNVFLVVAMIFHLGQAWVDFLAPNAKTYNSLTDFYSIEKINRAYFYAFCCIVLFHTGAIVCVIIRNCNFRKKYKFNLGIVKENIYLKKLFIKKPSYDFFPSYGMILFLVSFAAKLQIDIKFSSLVMSNGYMSIFDIMVESGYWNYMFIISGFYIPSVYILLFVFKNRIKYFNIVFYSSIIYGLIYSFIVGNRGNALIFTVSVILFRQYILKKYTKKEILGIVLFAVLILVFSSFIALTRFEARNTLTVSEIISQFAEYNLFFSSISEFGGSIMTLLVAMNYVPLNIDFGYGISYIASTSIILPDIFGWFDKLQPFISVSGILNKLHLGLGGSFIAEAYFNFGNYAFIIMIILGMVIGRYTFWLDNASRLEKQKLQYLWGSIMYFAVLMYIRDQFYTLTSGLLQYFIYPWILYFIYCKIILLLKLNKRLEKNERI